MRHGFDCLLLQQRFVQGRLAALAGPHADGVEHRHHEDLAVAGVARLVDLDDRPHDRRDQVVRHDDVEQALGDQLRAGAELHDGFLAAGLGPLQQQVVDLALAASHDRAGGEGGDARVGQRLLRLVHLVHADDRHDFFHGKCSFREG